MLSEELWKAGLVGGTAAEEAGKSTQGSFAIRGCFYLRMSECSREECGIKRTFSVGAQGFFKLDSANLKIKNQWLEYKTRRNGWGGSELAWNSKRERRGRGIIQK